MTVILVTGMEGPTDMLGVAAATDLSPAFALSMDRPVSDHRREFDNLNVPTPEKTEAL